MGGTLVQTARAAFIDRMRVTGVVATIVAIVVAAVAVTMLRSVQSSSAVEPDAQPEPPVQGALEAARAEAC